MDPLWLLALGMLVVVGAIVGLRLHAFLALLLAAVVVGLRFWRFRRLRSVPPQVTDC